VPGSHASIASEPAPFTLHDGEVRASRSTRELAQRTSKRPKWKPGMSRAMASTAAGERGRGERRRHRGTARPTRVEPMVDNRTCSPGGGHASPVGTLHWWRGEPRARRARASAADQLGRSCSRPSPVTLRKVAQRQADDAASSV
jgi:hypothetical protein